ncbi:uncharacterized protein TNCV_2675901 [Trichonephila clavipes]|nr:uncharacterized protein TNCV_2675901 [Trichonephila clavipes]
MDASKFNTGTDWYRGALNCEPNIACIENNRHTHGAHWCLTRPQKAGWSNRRIGRHFGWSDMVVARCWQQWITEGRVYRRGGSGRPRNTNDREDRAIRRVATSAPTTSLASIQRHLPPSRHPVPSRETIRETTDRIWLEEPTSAKTLTTDTTS